MYGELERRSVSGVSRWTYSVGGIGERRCPLTISLSTSGDMEGTKKMPNLVRFSLFCVHFNWGAFVGVVWCSGGGRGVGLAAH